MHVSKLTKLAMLSGAAILPSVGLAQFSATFEGGLGTSAPDEFTGTAGNGWAGGWLLQERTAAANSSEITMGLNSSTPISGSHSMRISAVDNRALHSDGGDMWGNARRNWDGLGSATPTSPFRLSYDLRVDTWDGADNAFRDIVQVFMIGADWTAGFNPGVGGMRIRGGLDIDNNVIGEFQVRNGGSTQTIAAADMLFVVGDTYRVEVDVVPAYNLDDTWNASLASWGITFTNLNSSQTYSLSGLAAPGNSTGVNWVNFGVNTNGDGAFSSISYSVDNISIVPEPSTYAAILGALVLIGVAMRRRRS